MPMIPEIVYAPANGVRGLGDLYLPAQPAGAQAALVIHGGGWNAMDKHGLAGIAEFLAAQGFGAFNVNYRLLDLAPWPACGDDCLAAARFLLAGGHEAMGQLRRDRLVIIGASAGGHLALWTGLHLPAAQVRAIVDISGPSDLLGDVPSHQRDWFSRTFFGLSGSGPAGQATDKMMRAASPINHLRPGLPPLLAVHSTNDQLVPLSQAEAIVAAWRKTGGRAETHIYAGPGDQHGIWIEGTDPHRLIDHIETAIAGFLKTV